MSSSLLLAVSVIGGAACTDPKDTSSSAATLTSSHRGNWIGTEDLDGKRLAAAFASLPSFEVDGVVTDEALAVFDGDVSRTLVNGVPVEIDVVDHDLAITAGSSLEPIVLSHDDDFGTWTITIGSDQVVVDVTGLTVPERARLALAAGIGVATGDTSLFGAHASKAFEWVFKAFKFVPGVGWVAVGIASISYFDCLFRNGRQSCHDACAAMAMRLNQPLAQCNWSKNCTLFVSSHNQCDVVFANQPAGNPNPGGAAKAATDEVPAECGETIFTYPFYLEDFEDYGEGSPDLCPVEPTPEEPPVEEEEEDLEPIGP